MDYKIRNAEEGDFLQISQLAENCSPMATERNSIYHIFVKFFNKTSLVVENTENNAITGFLLGFISQDKTNEAYIHLLCIDKSLRGEGLALKILDKFIEVVTSRGCNKISLISKPNNKRAIKFYLKHGFKSYSSNETIKEDGINVFKGYDGHGCDKVLFYKDI